MSIHGQEPFEVPEPPPALELSNNGVALYPFGHTVIDGQPSEKAVEGAILILNRNSPAGENVFNNWYRFRLPGWTEDEVNGVLQQEPARDWHLLEAFITTRNNRKFRTLRDIVEMGGIAMMYQQNAEDPEWVRMYCSLWFQNEADAMLVIMRISPLGQTSLETMHEQLIANAPPTT